MIEMLQYPFFQKAIIGGIIIAFLGSYYGVFVVQRKMSFLGSGLAHAAFGGVSIGLFMQSSPLWIAAIFTFVVAMLIVWLRNKTKLATDTLIGVFFAVSVAVGIILISLGGNLNVDAHSYLFGSVLTINQNDLIFGAILVAITVITIFTHWGKWSYATFDEELAKADGLNVKLHDHILAGLLAVTIVIAIKMVGILLISSFIVIPAAAARMLSRTFPVMTIISIIIGILTSLFGLWFSVVLDLPVGASVVILQSFVFATAMLISRLNNN
jgi:zinc transport system permease protein